MSTLTLPAGCSAYYDPLNVSGTTWSSTYDEQGAFMAQARVWNATPDSIDVDFTSSSRDLFSGRFTTIGTERRTIQPLDFVAYDNLSSYLSFKISGSTPLEASRIDWGDSWQYVVTPTMSNCSVGRALSGRYGLGDTRPNSIMDEHKSGSYLSKWMTASPNVIGNRPIWDIVLPGSHDAGSFSRGNTGYVRNHSRDIAEQLAGGARFLDIRVARRPDRNYVMFHDTIPPDESQSFDVALEQIQGFADDHPGEVVVVKMHRKFWPGDPIQKGDRRQEYTDFQDYCIRKLKSQLVVLSVPHRLTRVADPSEYTYNRCIARGQNIVMISPHGEEPTEVPPNQPHGRSLYYQWKDQYLGGHVLRDSWDAKQTFRGIFCDLTPQDKTAFIERQIPSWLQGKSSGNVSSATCDGDSKAAAHQQSVGPYFNCAAATIWTPKIIADNLLLVHPKVIEWSRVWRKDQATMNRMNIVYLDAFWSNAGAFFPVNPSVVPAVIGLNTAK